MWDWVVMLSNSPAFQTIIFRSRIRCLLVRVCGTPRASRRQEQSPTLPVLLTAYVHLYAQHSKRVVYIWMQSTCCRCAQWWGNSSRSSIVWIRANELIVRIKPHKSTELAKGIQSQPIGVLAKEMYYHIYVSLADECAFNHHRVICEILTMMIWLRPVWLFYAPALSFICIWLQSGVARMLCGRPHDNAR